MGKKKKKKKKKKKRNMFLDREYLPLFTYYIHCFDYTDRIKISFKTREFFMLRSASKKVLRLNGRFLLPCEMVAREIRRGDLFRFSIVIIFFLLFIIWQICL